MARAVLVAALASLAFEQSPANEAVRTAAALNVLEATENELVVGAVVAIITVFIEGVSSAFIAWGLQLRGGSVERLIERFRSKTHLDETEQQPTRRSHAKSVLMDVGIALGLGAGLVVVRHHLLEPERPFRADLVTASKATAIIAIVSGFIGVLVAGGIEHADAVGLGTPAQYFVDYATDWRFWLVVLGAAQGIALLRKFVMRRKGARQIAATT